MEDSTIWWIVAGIAVATELATGTFYLLMLALGLAGGAMAAHLGASSALQMTVAALLGGGAVAIWYLVRSRQPAGGPSSANRDINLDIGGTIHVDAWKEDRTASVKYRGAEWVAELAPDAPALTGGHRIVEVVGSRLIVSPIRSG
jgi:membrane protein implicated in regulation of membrane protease activity